MFYKTYHKKSFGMIEVIVVLGLFLLLVGTVLQVTVMASKNLVINQERWQATLIGQNWIEELRAIRDTNLMKGNLWDDWGEATSNTNSNRCFDKNMRKMVVSYQPGQCRVENLGQNYGGDGVLFYYAKLKYKHDYPQSNPTSSDIFTVDISWKNQGIVKTVSYSTFLKNLKVDQPVIWSSPGGGPSPSSGPTWQHPYRICSESITPKTPEPGFVFTYGCDVKVPNQAEYLQSGNYSLSPVSSGNVSAIYTGTDIINPQVQATTGNATGNWYLWVDKQATRGPLQNQHVITTPVTGSGPIWSATPISGTYTLPQPAGSGDDYLHFYYQYTITSVTGRVCGKIVTDPTTTPPTLADYCSGYYTFNPITGYPGISVQVYYDSALYIN